MTKLQTHVSVKLDKWVPRGEKTLSKYCCLTNEKVQPYPKP